jgi:large subunit ribosomal protein L21
MTIYAVMKTGGKEYRVAPGDLVRVEKLSAAPGATVEIREVCSLEIGKDVTVGSPTVTDARVVAEVVEQGHGEKIVSFKKKRRNHYQMTMEDLRSYSVLQIREIAVGETVYGVGATVTPSAPPAQISKPERKVREPQAKKSRQPPASPPPAPIELPPPAAAHHDAPLELPPSAPASPPPVAIELPPPMAARADPPAAPKVVSEERVAVESPPSVLSLTETAPTLDRRKRSYGVAALIVAVLVISVGLLVSGGGQPQGPVEVATAVAAPPEARAAVAQPAAKVPPRREAAIKNPAAASAPSAPVQPPE